LLLFFCSFTYVIFPHSFILHLPLFLLCLFVFAFLSLSSLPCIFPLLWSFVQNDEQRERSTEKEHHQNDLAYQQKNSSTSLQGKITCITARKKDDVVHSSHQRKECTRICKDTHRNPRAVFGVRNSRRLTLPEKFVRVAFLCRSLGPFALYLFCLERRRPTMLFELWPTRNVVSPRVHRLRLSHETGEMYYGGMHECSAGGLGVLRHLPCAAILVVHAREDERICSWTYILSRNETRDLIIIDVGLCLFLLRYIIDVVCDSFSCSTFLLTWVVSFCKSTLLLTWFVAPSLAVHSY